MRFERADVEGESLSSALASPLERDLPEFDPADPPYGFVFSTPHLRDRQGDPVAVFATVAPASVVDGRWEHLGVRLLSGEVVAAREGTRRVGYVNSSIADFLAFLIRIEEYRALSEILDPDPPSMTLTVAESDALVARLEQGTLRPRADREKRRKDRATLTRAMKTLRGELRDRDPKAMRPSSLWGATLREYADALP